MKFNVTATFLGSDVATSAKGNVYQKACIMVGADTLTLLCEDKNVLNIKKFSECVVDIDYRHYELNINFYSQDVDIDKKLVSLADTVYITERSMIPYFIYTKAIKRKFDVVDGSIVAIFKFIPWLFGGRKYIFAPKYWHLFDSWHREELPPKVWENWVFDVS